MCLCSILVENVFFFLFLRVILQNDVCHFLLFLSLDYRWYFDGSAQPVTLHCVSLPIWFGIASQFLTMKSSQSLGCRDCTPKKTTVCIEIVVQSGRLWRFVWWLKFDSSFVVFFRTMFMCKIKCNKVIWALCIQFIVCSFDHLLSFFSFLIWAHTTLKQLKQRSVVYFGLHLYISYGQNCNVFRCLFFCVCCVCVCFSAHKTDLKKSHIRRLFAICCFDGSSWGRNATNGPRAQSQDRFFLST